MIFFLYIFQCASPCWGATFPALARSLFCAPVSILGSRLLSVWKMGETKACLLTWLFSHHYSSYVRVCKHRRSSLEASCAHHSRVLHFCYICSGGFTRAWSRASSFTAADVTPTPVFKNIFLLKVKKLTCIGTFFTFFYLVLRLTAIFLQWHEPPHNFS